MKTFKRVCIKDFNRKEGDLELNLKRANEYITSPVDANGQVIVYTGVWGTAPVEIFAGEVEYTKDNCLHTLGNESPCIITESLSSLLTK